MRTWELLENKRDEILRIATSHGAGNIRVFGSTARRDDDEASDIDILVRLEPGVGLFQHAALVRELENLLGRKVDVVSDRGLRPRIKDRVLREAVPL